MESKYNSFYLKLVNDYAFPVNYQKLCQSYKVGYCNWPLLFNFDQTDKYRTSQKFTHCNSNNLTAEKA